MREIILIKLGGSLLTDKTKPYAANTAVIKRLCQEIKKAQEKTDALFILGNGAGSFGHVPAEKYCLYKEKITKTTLEGICLTRMKVSELNLLLIQYLSKANVLSVSISPASCVLATKGKITAFFTRPIFSFLSLGIMPIVFGDVVSSGKGGFSIVSTDTLLFYLSKNLKKRNINTQLVHLGATDGIYDGLGRTIKKLTADIFSRYQQEITGSKGVDVTGGMAFKAKLALDLAKEDIDTLIINGQREGELVKAVTGKKVNGTIITK